MKVSWDRRRWIGSALGAGVVSGASRAAGSGSLRDGTAKAVARFVADGQCPGAVVVVGHRNRVVLHEAFHLQQVKPSRKPMVRDAVFDLASLTKPIATATAIHLLRERGKLRLGDKVARHLDGFEANGKGSITVAQCLVHTAGFIPDNPLADYQSGVRTAWRNIWNLVPVSRPGGRFAYTDVGYLVLGKLVEKLSGRTLDRFVREEIFRPLGMTETGYLPDRTLRGRAVPTEQRGGRWAVGEVHDPRAHLLGGVAGHAGLFSTGADLAKYAFMILNGGLRPDGKRLLSAESAAEMTRVRTLPAKAGARTYGWDAMTWLSKNRSPRYGRRAFGHGGFTGTSIWFDPDRSLFVLLLSSRLHPDGRGSVNELAAEIGTLACEAVDRG